MAKRKGGSRKSGIRRTAENVIMICLVAIIALSGWKIYSILHNYDKNEDVYVKIAEEAKTEPTGFTGNIDFNALRKVNPDVVGWIYYKDSHIDYPIVQGEDNSRYLTTMFDGSYADFGTLFVDSVTDAPFRQFNTIVYGHHMRNGSMFGDLKKLKDEAYCNEHPEMKLITPDGRYNLEIWAFLNQPSDSEIYTTNIIDDESKEAYIKMVEEIANYTTGVSVGTDDRLVVLSTCAYEYQDARYMVVCKITPWE